MSGLDEGRLLAYLDGEVEPAERADVEAWLEESEAARAALEGVRERRSVVGRALAAADPPVPDLERVRARIQARVDGARLEGAGASRATGGWSISRPTAVPGGRRRLAQAAVLVLLLGAAGVSAAVPGSPVRAWLASLLDDGATPAVAPTSTAVEETSDDMGLRVRPADGRLAIDLTDLPDGTAVVVRLVDGERGAIYASRAAFRSGAGRIEATFGGASSPGDDEPGAVRVEIPRDAAAATLRVDGTVWLRKEGERLDFPGPAARVASDSIVFRGPGG